MLITFQGKIIFIFENQCILVPNCLLQLNEISSGQPVITGSNFAHQHKARLFLG